MDNRDLFHLPPQNIEAEESLLGSILINQTLIKDIINILTPEDFYRSAHQKIYRAMVELHESEKPIDLVTIVSYLRDHNHLEECGGASYLARLTEIVPYASNAMEYAMAIHKKACLRNIINTCHEVTKRCFEASDDHVLEIMSDAENKIKDIPYRDPKKTSFSTMSKLVEEGIDRYEERWANKGKPSGIITGYHLIDYITCGFQDSDFILMAARPSAGKTAFLMGAARKMASNDIPVGIFSLEMSKGQLFDRMISSKTAINLQKFRSGNFQQHEWDGIIQASGQLHNLPIFIDDRSGLHYSEICRSAKELKKLYNIQIIFIDYLQLIHSEGQNRNLELGRISRALKNLAKELNIPIMALSQLNRNLENRTDKRPRLADIRESGDFEQDADLVIFIYRHEMYLTDEEKQNHPEVGKAEFIIGKQRNGPTGMVKLAWRDKNASFYNLQVTE